MNVDESLFSFIHDAYSRVGVSPLDSIFHFLFPLAVLSGQPEDGAHHDGVAGRVRPGADLRAQPGNARHASESLLLQAASERSSQELQPLNDDEDDVGVRVGRTTSLDEFSLSHFPRRQMKEELCLASLCVYTFSPYFPLSILSHGSKNIRRAR